MSDWPESERPIAFIYEKNKNLTNILKVYSKINNFIRIASWSW